MRYYHAGHVEEIRRAGNSLVALVRGTRPQPYTVVLDTDRPADSYCSCPVGFECKHLAATIATVLSSRIPPEDIERRLQAGVGAEVFALPEAPDPHMLPPGAAGTPAGAPSSAAAAASRAGASPSAGGEEILDLSQWIAAAAYEAGAAPELGRGAGGSAAAGELCFTDVEADARYRLAFVIGAGYPGAGYGGTGYGGAQRPAISPVRQYRRKDGAYGRLEPIRVGEPVFTDDPTARRLATQLALLGKTAPVLAFAEELTTLRVPLFVGQAFSLQGCHDNPLTVVEPERIEAEIFPYSNRRDVHRALGAPGGLDGLGGRDPGSAVLLALHLQATAGEHHLTLSPGTYLSGDYGGGRSVLLSESGVLLIGGDSPVLPELSWVTDRFGLVTEEEIARLEALAKESPRFLTLRYPRRIRIVSVEPEPVFVLGTEERYAALMLQVEETGADDGYEGDDYVVHRPAGSPPQAALDAATAQLDSEPYFLPGEQLWVWELEGESAPADGLEAALALSGEGYRVYLADPSGGMRPIRRGGPLTVRVSSGTDWFELRVKGGDGTPIDEAQLAEISRRGGYTDGETLVLLDFAEAERIRRALMLAEGTDDGRRVSASDIATVAELADLADEVDADTAAVRGLVAEIAGSAEETAVDLPTGLTAELRPYQRSGFAWLSRLAHHGLSGCLADDMGLGKTLQALSLMLRLREVGEGGDGFLVVAPVSTLSNWAREATRFAPELTVIIHHGPQREDLTGRAGDGVLVATSYATALKDAEILGSFDWGLLCLDEAQFIKNPYARTTRGLKTFTARRRLCLTGTPVENLTTDLWSIMDFLVPGLLGPLRSFTARFPKRPNSGAGAERMETLRRIVSPFLLRRTKEAVAPELPPRIESTLTCEMGGVQARFYATLKRYHRDAVRAAIESGDIARIGAAVFTGLLRLRQAALYPEDADPTGEGVSSVKERELLAQLTEVAAEGHKALVFSQFVTALGRLEAAARSRGLATLYLDGKTGRRRELLERFQSAEGPVTFFISLKAGGTGINLTAADYVYLCDPWWNPQVERQAVDRAHRIGRVESVMVTRLVTATTVEEKVLELQAQKERLAADLIRENQGGLSLEEAEELLALFE